MTDDLVVNPYLQFQPFTDADSEFLLTAPKPGDGLRTLTVSRADQSNIFEVFSDLAQTRFDFLDAEKDLNEDERKLLVDNGVLVEAGTKPELPLFHCDLDDGDGAAGEIDIDDLVVNPTFRFEAFDLAKFGLWAKDKHLSPYQPSVWIKSPVIGIELGYWLSREDAETVSRFEAGGSLPAELDEALLRKLMAAEVVVSAEKLRQKNKFWTEKIETAKTEFAADKYAVLRGIFPPEQMQAMRRYYRSYVDNGFMPFGDTQVPGRYRQHNERFASFLHGQFTHLMSLITGAEVRLSYVYAASYKEGAILNPHTDREQCEYSISFQVDYQPEPEGQVSPWAIYVEPLRHSGELPESGLSFEWEQIEERRAKFSPPSPLYLAGGDGLIYKGRELIHYRRALPEGHRSTSLFFHFVAKDFQGQLN